jgi:hypothetical protein
MHFNEEIKGFMLLRNSVFAVAFFAVGYWGYQIGAGQHHQPDIQTIKLENVQVSQIHPAALYVRTLAGKEQRYLMEDRDRDWARTLLQNRGRRWNMELTTSPEWPSRYTLTTLVE